MRCEVSVGKIGKDGAKRYATRGKVGEKKEGIERIERIEGNPGKGTVHFVERQRNWRNL